MNEVWPRVTDISWLTKTNSEKENGDFSAAERTKEVFFAAASTLTYYRPKGLKRPWNKAPKTKLIHSAG